jgi:hypothetical protein
MALVNFTNLDFDQIKESIKDYLRSNSNFTDYDFEGSNLSTIVDILAYNTYISSYNANMVSNEVFIDSATLRENVVSLARNIGYVPRSRQCSVANISFFVEVENPRILSLTLQKGIVCSTSTSFGGQSFIFSIPENITVPVVDGIGFFENIEVYEGTFLIQEIQVDSINKEERYILENEHIDVNTIRVFVRENLQSNTSVKYSLSKSILDVKSASRIFYIQEIEDQRYEILFGDNIFGRKLESSNIIEISYIVTNGEGGNGIGNFTYSGRILDNNGNPVTEGFSLLTTLSESRNGNEIESVTSIKRYAPRIYSAQNRAVTSSDYESIIPRIYPQTESVSVFGGEELDPPEYGKVFLTIKPVDGNFLSDGIKRNIKNELKKYSVAGILPEILDLKYLYIEVFSNVYYNTNLSRSLQFDQDRVIKNIENFAKSNELNRYGARFKYSKFLNLIDNSVRSITSNITSVQMRRDLRPELGKFAEYEICYGNAFHVKNGPNRYNIKTSGFVVDGISGNVYIGDIADSNRKKGSLFLFRVKSDVDEDLTIIRKNIGTIDYEKGEILLNPIKIISTKKIKNDIPIIEISVSPKSNDILGKQDLYLQLNINDVQINMVEDTIESGSDLSGSVYIPSSSYLNGDIIRK